ncbi:hypothetical protein [Kineococcus sp. SYSU DK004]
MTGPQDVDGAGEGRVDLLTRCARLVRALDDRSPRWRGEPAEDRRQLP